MSVRDEYIPRPGEFDPLVDVDQARRNGDHDRTSASAGASPDKPLIEFWSPSQLQKYEPPPDQNMVGDFHLQRGAPTVLAGPPGCGKSRATLWLAVMGVRGNGVWFGMNINCRFRTLIIQCENSPTRLHRDFAALGDVEGMDDYIRISTFPPYRGFRFFDRRFRDELKTMIRAFQPDLIIVDPWNRVAKDSMQKDFQEALECICEVMTVRPEAACLILHHLRKPKADDRHKGRGLANLLSGSNILEGAARAVIIMQPASDDVEDDRVVMTCSKNNDGEHGPRTAWQRKAGWFEPVPDFDFEVFDSGGTRREAKVREEHLCRLFRNGHRILPKRVAAKELETLADVRRSAAYEALRAGGRFSRLLMFDPESGMIGMRQNAGEADDADVVEGSGPVED